MKEEIGVLLQPLVTLEEREMLVEISRCSNVAEVEAILPTWYTRNDMSANCRFIRFALAASLEIWSAKSLLNKGHGEDWYRMHIYSSVWETKRSECLSQVTKALKETNKDVKLQKLDFILRDLNTNNDVVTAEEKPSIKGVKADIRKGELLKKNSLYLWSKQVKSDILMEQLESISCQWQGTKFSIYGSRLVSPDKIVTYKKGVFNLPISGKHLSEFARLLLAVLSLKRVVKLNYAKFILILEERYKQEIEILNFNDATLNETSFLSNSTDSTDSTDKECGEYQDEDLKQFSDWEDLLLFDSVKRRRTR